VRKISFPLLKRTWGRFSQFSSSKGVLSNYIITETSFADAVEDAVQKIREERERDRLRYGEATIDYDWEYREAAGRHPQQQKVEFNRARIAAAQSGDARDLGTFFEGVRRLTASWVPDIDIMHEQYDYNN